MKVIRTMSMDEYRKYLSGQIIEGQFKRDDGIRKNKVFFFDLNVLRGNTIPGKIRDMMYHYKDNTVTCIFEVHDVTFEHTSARYWSDEESRTPELIVPSYNNRQFHLVQAYLTKTLFSDARAIIDMDNVPLDIQDMFAYLDSPENNLSLADEDQLVAGAGFDLAQFME